ncbi:MAG: hypothetical protein DMF75_18370 [Acidobacteria bacterium]|nr:MAG: hypothetical protein DMF75_18370 [Acidobacteriota bacterium]
MRALPISSGGSSCRSKFDCGGLHKEVKSRDAINNQDAAEADLAFYDSRGRANPEMEKRAGVA